MKNTDLYLLLTSLRVCLVKAGFFEIMPHKWEDHRMRLLTLARLNDCVRSKKYYLSKDCAVSQKQLVKTRPLLLWHCK